MAALLLITPARDEAAHLERTIRAVAAQTRAPDLWLIVDDGSTDATPEILARLAARGALPARRCRRRQERRGERRPARRGGRGAGLQLRPWRAVDLDDFTHVGKLDADIELPAEYFERLLDRFEREPELGIAGGGLLERGRSGWQPTKVPGYHVRGALKLYSRECFDAIGGIEERLGWDTIDETYARMHGYTTRSLPELAARHHRPVATRGGALRGRARHGQCAYILRYGAWWVALRSLKVACSRPYGLSGPRLPLRLPARCRCAARTGSRTSGSAASSPPSCAIAPRRGTGNGSSKAVKVPTFFMRS